MNMEFENKYMGVLQNMETVIVRLYRQNPEIADYNVDKAVEGLVRTYQAEQKGRSAPVLKLNELDQQLYSDISAVCQFYLGRTSELLGIEDLDIEDMVKLTVEDIIACLKRIRQSIAMWTKEGGRQGYLNFIDPFLP